ncbi:MAG TPA: hypothetical protein VKF62_03335, partial [Planctomycetota bacterium]|nr:hypothetical protein [Planctomycetota bacterium]
MAWSTATETTELRSSSATVAVKSTTVYRARLTTPNAGGPLGTTQMLTLDAPTRAGHDDVVALSHAATPTPLGGAMVLPVDATVRAPSLRGRRSYRARGEGPPGRRRIPG